MEGRKFGHLALVMHSHNGGLAICGAKEREQVKISNVECTSIGSSTNHQIFKIDFFLLQFSNVADFDKFQSWII